MEEFVKKAEELAGNNYKIGINCAEAIIKTFDDLCQLGIGENIKYATGFGGGIGYSGDLCGVVSGSVFVLGAFKGRPNPPEGTRDDVYALGKEFRDRFVAKNTATDCEFLHKFEFGSRDQRLNCLKLVSTTAGLLAEFLLDKGLVQNEGGICKPVFLAPNFC